MLCQWINCIFSISVIQSHALTALYILAPQQPIVSMDHTLGFE